MVPLVVVRVVGVDVQVIVEVAVVVVVPECVLQKRMALVEKGALVVGTYSVVPGDK